GGELESLWCLAFNRFADLFGVRSFPFYRLHKLRDSDGFSEGGPFAEFELASEIIGNGARPQLQRTSPKSDGAWSGRRGYPPAPASTVASGWPCFSHLQSFASFRPQAPIPQSVIPPTGGNLRLPCQKKDSNWVRPLRPALTSSRCGTSFHRTSSRQGYVRA